MAVQAPETTPNPLAAVEFSRADLTLTLPDYIAINDCMAGERFVKLRGELYLPRPDAGDLSPMDPRSIARYDAYKTRAVFYNVAQRTLDGLVGEVFLRPPAVTVPPQIEAVIKDANGTGASLEQLSKLTLGAVLSKGRAGIFIDYPAKGDADTTVAEQQAGYVRPTIVFYEPENIINWKVIKRGGKYILSLVVLREYYDRDQLGFEGTFVTQTAIRYRVLQLINDVYVQSLYQLTENSTPQVFNITDGEGNPLIELPFTFVGAKDNSPSIDPAPMLAICQLNLGHYRNSADYEEACFVMGQPTVVVAGLTKQWVDEVLPNGIRVGSRGGIPLPVGATANIIQVQPNTMVKEAMDTKERQMAALGAKLVEQRTVTQTATEAEINSSAETSVLQSCAGNVEAAIKWALEWAGIFANAIKFSDDANARGVAVKYEINSDFDIMRLSWQDRQQMLKEWQANAITTDEYRANLRRAGIATLDDDDFEQEQADQIAEGLAQQAELIKMQAAAGGQNNAPGKGTPIKSAAKPGA
jgi:hypothetical protein